MTKSTITRERLEELAAGQRGFNLRVATYEESQELARIALAAMDSEPVAWTWHYREQWHVTNDEERARDLAWDGVKVEPLYRHAQQSVVPDEIKHRIGGLGWGWEGEFNRGWNACRAAMLEQQLVDRVDEKSLTSINPAPDLVSLQKKAESIIGNYPGIPDCWCRTCRPVVLNDMRFVVCPDCGNKRCPRANDHRNACTGSNEPGQEGSAYPDTLHESKP
ncbi:hypothetical protein [Klebsiella pneumoniae]|uniref:hypothetical protein n=1 Tax=Klebsiella pneumoniae TaxID=573 RepID=UPI00387220DA